MSFIAARSIALADAVEAVNRLHGSVLDTGSDSPETNAAAGKAAEAVAQAKDFGITTTDIGLAVRAPSICWFCAAENGPSARTCGFCHHRPEDGPNAT